MDLCIFCMSMDFHGNPRTSMDIHGKAWTSIGYPWISMDCGRPWKSITPDQARPDQARPDQTRCESGKLAVEPH
jgi:hypothetical protein